MFWDFDSKETGSSIPNLYRENKGSEEPASGLNPAEKSVWLH